MTGSLLKVRLLKLTNPLTEVGGGGNCLGGWRGIGLLEGIEEVEQVATQFIDPADPGGNLIGQQTPLRGVRLSGELTALCGEAPFQIVARLQPEPGLVREVKLVAQSFCRSFDSWIHGELESGGPRHSIDR